jgi:hypothetical protein
VKQTLRQCLTGQTKTGMPANTYPAFSVDFDSGANLVRGWAAPSYDHDNASTSVRIRTFKGSKDERSPVEFRPSISERNFHKTGMVGFSFSPDCPMRGDFFTLQISSDHTDLHYKHLAGPMEQLATEFAKFEIPRDDNSVLEPSTEELLSSGSDALNLKKLIVRLRRAKRGKESVGRFVGVPHRYIESDLHALKTLTWSYFRPVSRLIGVRYLWSVADCIADYGTTEESLRAYSLSQMMHVERMAQTYQCVYHFAEKPKSEQVRAKQLPYWGAMLSNRLNQDDSLDIMMVRAIETLSPDPLIYAIFCEMMLQAAASSNSLLSFNTSNSEWFASSFHRYRTLFQSHLDEFNEAPAKDLTNATHPILQPGSP